MSALPAPLPWQQGIWQRLTAAVATGKLSHAYLFSGQPGIGKHQLARAFAAFVVCESPVNNHACGTCRGCVRLAAGTNPDATSLSVDGHRCLCAEGREDDAIVLWQPGKESRRQEIATDAVRNLIEHFNLSSQGGRYRVALIEPADALNESSVDAMLKTLEEPGAGNVLILVSDQPLRLKPTLLSRCQMIRLPTPAEAVALEWLRTQQVAAAPALQAARGAPLRALQLQECTLLELYADWEKLLDEVGRGNASPLAANERIGKEHALEFSHWLQGWTTTALRGFAGAGTSAQSPASLLRLQSAAIEARERLEGNVPGQLVLESLLIYWARLTAAERRSDAA